MQNGLFGREEEIYGAPSLREGVIMSNPTAGMKVRGEGGAGGREEGSGGGSTGNPPNMPSKIPAMPTENQEDE